MAVHPEFPTSPYAILDPAVRWFPADETLRETSMDKLMPPLVPELRRAVKEWRGDWQPRSVHFRPWAFAAVTNPRSEKH